MLLKLAAGLMALSIAMGAGAQPRADAAAERAKFRLMQQSDGQGRVQPDGLLKAQQARSAILARKPSALTGSTSAAVPVKLEAGISPPAWTALGPGNIGGRVRAIAFLRNGAFEGFTTWIGTASGGMWKTSNHSGDWSLVYDFKGLSISSMVGGGWVATGDGYSGSDAGRGGGIFRSTDGGVSWNALPSTNPLLNPDWYYVNTFAVRGSVILAATNNGLYRSADTGATWSRRTGNMRIDDVKFDPNDSQKALLAPGLGGPLLYSTDGGITWGASDLVVPGRTSIAYTGNYSEGGVYASVDTNPPGIYNPSGSVYKSLDGGVHWTLQGSPLHLGTQGWYANSIWTHKEYPHYVMVGGNDLYQSNDSGVTWAKISDSTLSNSVHGQQHAIVPREDDVGLPTAMYVGTDGGIYVGSFRTATPTSWTNLNHGLEITEFVSGAGHSGTNGHIIGGTRASGSLVYSGSGTNWTPFFGGQTGGGASAIDPGDGNYIYGEDGRLQIHRSTTGSATATYIYQGINDAGSLANYVAPFVLDPNNANTMLAGGESVWRSVNVRASAPSWSYILAPTSGGGTATFTSQIAIAQGNSDLVWVGKNNGSLWKTVNGTAVLPTWNPKGAGTLPTRMVLSLLIDKDNNNLVYAGFGGYFNDNLWRSTDGGTSWSNIGSGLPPSPVRTIQRHPSNPAFLYAGTEVGIFTSEDGGATWTTTNEGPANVSVEQLFWLNATDLVAATYGRGMFRTSAVGSGPYILKVTKTGSGSGPVTSNPTGITCGTLCSAYFASGSSVTLTATPNSGSVFGGWSGACSGTSTCVVTMNAAKNVTATFNPAPTYALTVSKAGTGSGPVTSSPSGVACGSICNVNFAPGTIVTLTATPNSGSVFAGWSGACSGTSTCVVTMDAAKSVTATFNPAPTYALTISKAGAGSGPVTSNPAAIGCGSVCTAGFAPGTSVTLTATPNYGSVFGGWSGACSGTSTCVVTMDAAKSVTATFNPAPTYALVVSKGGTGDGPISSNPSGINCGATCSANFPSGTTVTLTASPNAISTFTGWSGACSGTSSFCVVSMNAAKSATANFTLTGGYTLTVSKAGPGVGQITSNPAGINCGSTCSYGYASGANVTLTATPNSGSVFAGWSGACSGTSSTCVVTMNAAKSATATFNPTNFALTISKAGAGSGPVTSSPSGVVCGSICNVNFASGSSVTLTATPNSGSVFAGWSGACSGISSTCVVSMDAAKSVTATYNLVNYALTISKAGTGSGPVTSSPAGITCGSICSANFVSGTGVTLTATPNSGSVFAGWSGACSGTSTTCVLDMNAAKSVTATFNLP